MGLEDLIYRAEIGKEKSVLLVLLYLASPKALLFFRWSLFIGLYSVSSGYISARYKVSVL